MRNVFYFNKDVYKALILQTDSCPVNYTGLAGELSGSPRQTSTSKSGCCCCKGSGNKCSCARAELPNSLDCHSSSTVTA